MQISDARLSSTDAKKINSILKKNFPGTSVQVSGGGTASVASTCEDACNLAQAVAEEACEELGGGIPTAICKLAAKAAGDLCRDAC
jgi:hypothetical protein